MGRDIDEQENIPKKIPKAAREMSGFLYLVIDEAMNQSSSPLMHTTVRCFKKKCEGTISCEILEENDVISRQCSKCNNGGTISHSENTSWDNG